MDIEKAFKKLQELQQKTNINLAIHWAFIDGENDSQESVSKLMKMVEEYRLHLKFNLVRYNPFSEKQGKESSEEIIAKRFEEITPYMKVEGSRIVPRVGFDVKASCGMFVLPNA